MMLSGNTWLWIGFNIFVLAMLALDLGVFHRKAHSISIREALTWSGVWIALAMTFNAGIYFFSGSEPALQFFTGYLIEKSLSVDNIFVFVLLFAAFSVPAAYQHRVLFWGVLGALIMRGTMIGLGVVLLEAFHWIIYLFGAFLIFTGIRMAFLHSAPIRPACSYASCQRRSLAATASQSDRTKGNAARSRLLLRSQAGRKERESEVHPEHNPLLKLVR